MICCILLLTPGLSFDLFFLPAAGHRITPAGYRFKIFFTFFVTKQFNGRLPNINALENELSMSLALFESQVVPVRQKLYRFAFHLLGNEEDARDITQDALLKVWQQKERMTELQNMEAWCMRIVRNLALDKLKSRKYRRSEELDRAGEVPVTTMKDPHEAAAQQDAMNRVHQLMGALPEKYRTIMQLRDIEGYAYQEIADILEIDLNDVKVNLHRARKTVREQLQKLQVYGVQ